MNLKMTSLPKIKRPPDAPPLQAFLQMLTYIAIKEGSNWYGMFYLFISKLSSWGTSAFSNLVGSKNGTLRRKKDWKLLCICKNSFITYAKKQVRLLYFAFSTSLKKVPSLVCSESCTIGSCSKAVDRTPVWKTRARFQFEESCWWRIWGGFSRISEKKRRTEFTRWMILRRFQAAKRLWKMNVIAVSFACVLIIRQKRLDSSSNPRILFISSKGSDFSGSSKWA